MVTIQYYIKAFTEVMPLRLQEIRKVLETKNVNESTLKNHENTRLSLERTKRDRAGTDVWLKSTNAMIAEHNALMSKSIADVMLIIGENRSDKKVSITNTSALRYYVYRSHQSLKFCEKYVEKYLSYINDDPEKMSMINELASNGINLAGLLNTVRVNSIKSALCLKDFENLLDREYTALKDKDIKLYFGLVAEEEKYFKELNDALNSIKDMSVPYATKIQEYYLNHDIEHRSDKLKEAFIFALTACSLGTLIIGVFVPYITIPMILAIVYTGANVNKILLKNPTKESKHLKGLIDDTMWI